MGSVDQFLMAHVQGGLEAGERVLGLGLLRRPDTFTRMGVPARYTSFLGAATDRRLILFRTEVGGLLSAVAQTVIEGAPVIWSYAEIAAVRLKPVEGLVIHSGGQATAMTLIPFGGAGPFPDSERSDDPAPVVPERYDIYAAAEHLDGQRAFFNQFPTWLQGQVAARAFPADPARVAAVNARIAQRRVEIAARMAERERQRLARNAALEKAAPYVARAVAVLGTIALVVLALAVSSKGFDHLASARRMVESTEIRIRLANKDLEWATAGKSPPADCPEKANPAVGWLDLRTCHLCVEAVPREKRYPGWRSVTREGQEWWCPHGAYVKRTIANLEAERDEDEQRALGALVRGVGGALAALALLAGLAGAAAWDLKRRRAPSAPVPARA